MPRIPGGPYRVDLQAPIAKHPLNETLISWWLVLPHLSGGRRSWDLCNRHHGTLTNHPTDGTAWRTGPNNFGALAFDGTDDYVESLTADDALDVSKGTLSAWVYPTSNSGGRTIFGWRVNGSNEVNLYDNNGVTSQGLIYQYNAGGTNKTVNVSSLTANSWYHVAMTWNKAGDELKGYLNGEQIGTTQTGLGAMAGTPLWLRMGNDAFGGAWQGRLGDLQLHNQALSVPMVRALYNQSRCGHPDTLQRYPDRSWFVLRQSATATNYPQDLTSSLGSSSAFLRCPNKFPATSCSTSSALNRALARDLTSSTSTSPTFTKSPDHFLISSCAESSTLSRAPDKALTSTEASSSALVRDTNHLLTSTQGESSTLNKGPSRALSSSADTSSTVSRLVARALMSSAGLSSAMIKALARAFSSSLETSSAFLYAFGRVFTSTVEVTSDVTKAVGKSLSSSALALSSSISKGIGKALSGALAVASALVSVLAAIYSPRTVADAIDFERSHIDSLTFAFTQSDAITFVRSQDADSLEP